VGLHVLVRCRCGCQAASVVRTDRDIPRRTLENTRWALRCSMPPSFRAIFIFDDSDCVWLVDFPALVGYHTYGETIEEARAMALEALQVWLDQDDVEVDEDIRPPNAATG